MESREKPLFDGKRFQVVEVEYQVRGETVRKEVIRHPGAVVIAGELDDGRLLLVENYRPAIGRKLLELPAGTRSQGEGPLETAKREFKEETGYTAASWEPIAEFLVSPGMMSERMWMFRATGLTAGEQRLEPDESIELRPKSAAELRELLADGSIEDAKTLIGVMRFLARSGS